MTREKQSQIQAIVTAMHRDQDGQQILERLMIDRFMVPDESWYASVKTMHEVLQTGGTSHAAAKSQ